MKRIIAAALMVAVLALYGCAGASEKADKNEQAVLIEKIDQNEQSEQAGAPAENTEVTASAENTEAAAPAEDAEQTAADGAVDIAQAGENIAQAGENIGEVGQNPIMNFVGNYGCGRANAHVGADGMEKSVITVTWGSSAWEYSEWIMSGVLDTDTLTVEYDDCVRTDYTYSDEGEIATAVTAYENGSGRIKFHLESNTMTWVDDTEHAADDMVFEFAPAPEYTEDEEESTDYYSGVTALSSQKVEDVCTSVRTAYLNEDWSAITGMISYPIQINGTKLSDADEFLVYMSDKTVHESDRAAMEEETCHEMFFNGQGICMGSGQVWLVDPTYMTDEFPYLEIIAISGIVEK